MNNLFLDIYHVDGTWERRIETHNLVTNVGRESIRLNLFTGGTARSYGFGHLGSGTTAPKVTDTTLENDNFQKAWDSSTSGTGHIYREIRIADVDGNGSVWGEAGCFNSASPTSSMYARAVFPQVTKDAQHFFVLTWVIDWVNR